MNRPRRASKKPTGPSITIAESAQVMRDTRADPNKRISRDKATEAVRDLFARGEVSVEYKQISLICPTSNKRMVDPVRGVICAHLECFDLGTYLQLQVKNPYWECPLCPHRVEADDLRFDEYTSSVLLELGNVRSIEVLSNGSYRRVDTANVVDPLVVFTIGEVTAEAPLQENDHPTEERLVVVPLKALQDLGHQTKDLRRQLPEKKDRKRKCMSVDPADVAEALHDSIRGIIKQATSLNSARTNTVNCAARTSTQPTEMELAAKMYAKVDNIIHKIKASIDEAQHEHDRVENEYNSMKTRFDASKNLAEKKKELSKLCWLLLWTPIRDKEMEISDEQDRLQKISSSKKANDIELEAAAARMVKVEAERAEKATIVEQLRTAYMTVCGETAAREAEKKHMEHELRLSLNNISKKKQCIDEVQKEIALLNDQLHSVYEV